MNSTLFRMDLNEKFRYSIKIQYSQYRFPILMWLLVGFFVLILG